jgi:hypothetical protein
MYPFFYLSLVYRSVVLPHSPSLVHFLSVHQVHSRIIHVIIFFSLSDRINSRASLADLIVARRVFVQPPCTVQTISSRLHFLAFEIYVKVILIKSVANKAYCIQLHFSVPEVNTKGEMLHVSRIMQFLQKA